MKVPEPRKLKSGTWFIQLRLGGESIPVTADTAKECKQKAALIKAEHRAGKRSPHRTGSVTLGEAIDAYCKARENTLSPSTIRGYKTIKRNYLSNIMGKPLSSIDNWQKIIDAEAKRLSAKTIRNTWRFIGSVLRENDLPVPRLTLPMVMPAQKVWLEPEEVTSFVAAVKDTSSAIPGLLALHSLRLSEILALDWKDVDLKKNTIRVAAASVYDENQKLVTKDTTKNATSARTLPIMIPELKTMLEAVEEKKGKLVSCSPQTVRSRINKVCEENGLPQPGVHGLRHSFASLAFHLGLSEQETMELGGWADTTTMHKIYTHLAKADRLKSQNKLAAFFAKSDPQPENANENAN